MREVVITAEAAHDLQEIHAYLLREAPSQADVALARLEAACTNLAETALQYPLFPGREERGVRRRVVRPYNVLYRLRGDLVEVVHVLHGARDAERLLFPEN
ncbi:MAG: type II toxin-antitoxin system RelE/ParE family toxin [Hyphomicrobiales bacterium]|nr:MAG: type II toxin-antitoxin system RelE/ParE family toxin [Hyphomicrobiales bacterium]